MAHASTADWARRSTRQVMVGAVHAIDRERPEDQQGRDEGPGPLGGRGLLRAAGRCGGIKAHGTKTTCIPDIPPTTSNRLTQGRRAPDLSLTLVRPADATAEAAPRQKKFFMSLTFVN